MKTSDVVAFLPMIGFTLALCLLVYVIYRKFSKKITDDGSYEACLVDVLKLQEPMHGNILYLPNNARYIVGTNTLSINLKRLALKKDDIIVFLCEFMHFFVNKYDIKLVIFITEGTGINNGEDIYLYTSSMSETDYMLLYPSVAGLKGNGRVIHILPPKTIVKAA